MAGACAEDTRRAHLCACAALAHVRATGAGHAFVDARIAVIVDVVADLRRGHTTRAHAALIDDAVAVVVHAIADLRRHGTAGATGVEGAFVDGAIAVAVHAVAGVDGLHAQVEGAGIGGVAAELGEAFVDGSVAVLIRVVAGLDEQGTAHDIRQTGRERIRVIRQKRAARAARCGDTVELAHRTGGNRQTDHVDIDARRVECRRCRVGIAATGLAAVRQQDHRIGPASGGRIAGNRGARQARAHRVHQTGQRRRPAGPEFTVAAAQSVAEVAGGGAGVEARLAVVDPTQERRGVVEAHKGARVGEVHEEVAGAAAHRARAAVVGAHGGATARVPPEGRPATTAGLAGGGQKGLPVHATARRHGGARVALGIAVGSDEGASAVALEIVDLEAGGIRRRVHREAGQREFHVAEGQHHVPQSVLGDGDAAVVGLAIAVRIHARRAVGAAIFPSPCLGAAREDTITEGRNIVEIHRHRP